MRILVLVPILAVAVIASLLVVSTMSTTVRQSVSDNVSPKITQQSEEYSGEIPPVVKESKDPRPDVPVPPNALATPGGGYVTPLRTDEEGRPLNVEYLTEVQKS